VLGLSRSQVRKQIAQGTLLLEETDFGKALKLYFRDAPFDENIADYE